MADFVALRDRWFVEPLKAKLLPFTYDMWVPVTCAELMQYFGWLLCRFPNTDTRDLNVGLTEEEADKMVADMLAWCNGERNEVVDEYDD